MRIESITVNNFKSLVDFRIDLAKFSCVIGLNGSGKSTLLQFIDFLGQQMIGNVEGWLKERSWQARDLKSQLLKKTTIEFEVNLIDENLKPSRWSGKFNTLSLHCTAENIVVPGASLHAHGKQFSVAEFDEDGSGSRQAGYQPVAFTYQGSILSQLREDTLPEPLVKFRQFFRNVKSLDLLSPHFLHQRTRESEGSLGLGGQRLSAFLHELGAGRQRQLVQRLTRVYPQLSDVHTRSLKSGWKQLEISESYEGSSKSGLLPRMTTEARHVADGILRLIAILAELESDHRFLLFDEIENGINPELVEFVLEALTSTDKQVLVTTHSPMILNYLEDEVAREGVVYLYKTPRGATRAIRFFSIPSVAEKLTVMGPGEAFVDTHLKELNEEIEAVTEGQ